MCLQVHHIFPERDTMRVVKEELQSWFKFNQYESWRDNFYLPVSQKTFDSLSDDGVMMINILDPKVKTKDISGDELVDIYYHILWVKLV